ncbi:MAG: RNA 2',3'-cyclic phosphodiesterase [Candidatus Micrarchaeia archaeon]
MRAFFAIFPPEQVQTELLALQDEIEKKLQKPLIKDEKRILDGAINYSPKSRWKKTDVQNMHITLQFLGDEVTVHKIEDAKKAIDNAVKEIYAFEVFGKGVGAFPNARKATVLWAGAESNLLFGAAREVNKALEGAGFKSDKPFLAHISIERTKFAQDVDDVVREFADKKWCKQKWVADSICLVQSSHTLGGMEYNVLKSWKLEKV